jgi:Domain of unknown function (DUF1844)
MADTQGDGFVMQGGGEPVSFSTFILGLASNTLIHLGAAPHPETGGTAVDLTLARHTLALLDLLKAKTQGNLTAEEAQLFQSVLTDLKLRFVEASST